MEEFKNPKNEDTFEFDDAQLKDLLDFGDGEGIPATPETETTPTPEDEDEYKGPTLKDFKVEGQDKEEPKPEKKEEESDEDDEQKGNSEEIDVEAEAAFLEQLVETTGFEITPEELEKAEGDIGKIIEEKKYAFANQALQNHVSQFGEAEQQAIAALLSGATLDSIAGSSNVPTLNYTKDDLEDDTDLQRKAIEDLQRLKGRTDKEIKRYLKGMDEDELLEEAQSAYDEFGKLKEESEKSRLEQTQRQAEEQRRKNEEATRQIVEATDKFFEDTTKFLPEVKLRSNTKETIKSQIFDVYREINGDLGKYLPRIAMLKHLGVLDGDISKLTKNSNSKLAEAYAKKLRSTKNIPSSTSTITKENKSYRPPMPFTSRK